MRVFPNPSVGDVSLELTDQFSENLVVKIYNTNGSNILTKKIKAGETRIEFDNQIFTNAGFYLFKVFSEKMGPLSMGKIFIVR
jgi:hypothetical protein